MNSTIAPMKCQNCQLPVEVDHSLVDLSLAQRKLLLNSGGEPLSQVYRIPQERLQKLSHIRKPSELSLQKSVVNSLDSYVFLHGDSSTLQRSNNIIASSGEEESGDDEEEDSTTKTLSSHVNALTNIFNILSSKGNIDYPVCQDCCDLLMQKLKSEYDDAIKERGIYSSFLSRLQKQQELDALKPKKQIYSSEEVDGMKTEQEKLLQELLELEKQDDELVQEIVELEKQLQLKNEQQAKELQKQNLEDLEKIEFVKEVQSLKNQYELTLNNLDKLRKTNIFNETFRISHDGPFGTINRLRLGGFDEVRVPWQEINAAMGQLVLLLATISTRLHFKLDGYRLRPMGSFSKVEKFDVDAQDWVSYDAFNNGEFKLGKFFYKETSFDKALECILAVVDQMASRLSSTSTEQEVIELPYTMHNDKINGITIKLFGNKPNIEWTTACKLLLTNAKWLLAFSSSRISPT